MAAVRYMLCACGFVDDVMLAHNKQPGKGNASKRSTQVTHQGQHRLGIAECTQTDSPGDNSGPGADQR